MSEDARGHPSFACLRTLAELDTSATSHDWTRHELSSLLRPQPSLALAQREARRIRAWEASHDLTEEASEVKAVWEHLHAFLEEDHLASLCECYIDKIRAQAGQIEEGGDAERWEAELRNLFRRVTPLLQRQRGLITAVGGRAVDIMKVMCQVVEEFIRRRSATAQLDECWEAFLRLLAARALKTGPHSGPLPGWLCEKARQLCTAMMRNEMREPVDQCLLLLVVLLCEVECPIKAVAAVMHAVHDLCECHPSNTHLKDASLLLTRRLGRARQQLALGWRGLLDCTRMRDALIAPVVEDSGTPGQPTLTTAEPLSWSVARAMAQARRASHDDSAALLRALTGHLSKPPFQCADDMRAEIRQWQLAMGKFDVSAWPDSPIATQVLAYHQALEGAWTHRVETTAALTAAKCFCDVLKAAHRNGLFPPLLPCLIAVEQLPLTAGQLTVACKWSMGIGLDTSKADGEVWSQCLRTALIASLHQCQRAAEAKYSAEETEAEKAEQALLTIFVELLEDGTTLAESARSRYLVWLHLWLKKLQRFYDLQSPPPAQGQADRPSRREVLAKAQTIVEEVFKAEEGEVAVGEMFRQLRGTLHRLCFGDSVDVGAVWFVSLLKAQGLPRLRDRDQALEQLTQAFWHGLLPYTHLDTEEGQVRPEPTALALCDDHLVDAIPASRRELVRRVVKTSCDDSLVQEEASALAKQLQTAEADRRTQLQSWVASANATLHTIPPDQLASRFRALHAALRKATQRRRVPPPVASTPRSPLASRRQRPAPSSPPADTSLWSASEWIDSLVRAQSSVTDFCRQLGAAKSSLNAFLDFVARRIAQRQPVADDDERALLRLHSVLALGPPAPTAKALLHKRVPDLRTQLLEAKMEGDGAVSAFVLVLLKRLQPLSPAAEKMLHEMFTKGIRRPKHLRMHLNNHPLCNPPDPHLKAVLRGYLAFLQALDAALAVMGPTLVRQLRQTGALWEATGGEAAVWDLDTASHLLWVLPQLQRGDELFAQTRLARLPQNWLPHLLLAFCAHSADLIFQPLQLQLPLPLLRGKELREQDAVISSCLASNHQTAEAHTTRLNAVLTALSSLGNSDPSSTLLLAVTTQLAPIAAKTYRCAVDDLLHCLERLTVLSTLRVLSREMRMEDSSLMSQLRQPSFEVFRGAVTRAWLRGQLSRFLRVSTSQVEELYHSLMEVESTKPREVLEALVAALVGKTITPAVVDAVRQMSVGELEMGAACLAILAGREEGWYEALLAKSHSLRNADRSLAVLVDLIRQEEGGINASLSDLLESHPQGPALERHIRAIHDEEERVRPWNEEQVLAWATDNRGSTFADDVKRLITGLAVVSHGCRLLWKHPLRDTQLLALFLLLRPPAEGGQLRGRLCQMFTGEGKTRTFACLAILRAMCLHYVDVLTTSSVLARRDATESAPLFRLFGLLVTNNCDRDCEEGDGANSAEEVRRKRYSVDGRADGRLVDVVYGDVGSFERDRLMTDFRGHQPKEQIMPRSRMGENLSALIDEVDGLFLDNSGMVLYLSHSVDSLRFVERIFVDMWAIVNQRQQQGQPIMPDEVAREMQAKIDSGKLLVPSYRLKGAEYAELGAVVRRKLRAWATSAVVALGLTLDDEYRVMEERVTVMDKGTGVEQFSLKWSHGLHQFLQLKHGLELSVDSLKAVFLSNLFFFRLYGPHVYGLSGTLGSSMEQRYLTDIYHVDLCKVPRFRGELYRQTPATVCGTAREWLDSIHRSVTSHINGKRRAVLVICESVQAVMVLKEALQTPTLTSHASFLQEASFPTLTTYTSSLQELSYFSAEQPRLVEPGDLILATNLAGRGADLKTSQALNGNGGLHVILSFVPLNVRVQEQGFGRTARAGSEGSGEFVVLDIQRRSIAALCGLRDSAEQRRLERLTARDMRRVEVEHELLYGFHHEGRRVEGFKALFEHVAQQCRHRQAFYCQAQLVSLQNRWAFWLDANDQRMNVTHLLGKRRLLAEFSAFRQSVLEDLSAGGQQLVKEPVELIKLAGEYRREGCYSEAEACLARAAECPHYAYANYYKAACLLIRSPSASIDAKVAFKRDARLAMEPIKAEMALLQDHVNTVSTLSARRRALGERGFGDSFGVRGQERAQIWSIFLSAIDSAVGSPLTLAHLTECSKVTDQAQAKRILDSLADQLKPQRLSKRFRVDQKKKELQMRERGKDVYRPLDIPPNLLSPAVLQQLHELVESRKRTSVADGHRARAIDEAGVAAAFDGLLTLEKAKDLLCKSNRCTHSSKWSLAPIPPGWPHWEDAAAVPSSAAQLVLSEVVQHVVDQEAFPRQEHVKQALRLRFDDVKARCKPNRPVLAEVEVDSFWTLLRDHQQLLEKVDITIEAVGPKPAVDGAGREEKSGVGQPNVDPAPGPAAAESNRYDSTEEAQAEVARLFPDLEESLRLRICRAICVKETLKDGSRFWWLRRTFPLKELMLPTSTEGAGRYVWNAMCEAGAIKPQRLNYRQGSIKEQKETIKNRLCALISDEEAQEAVLGVVEGSFGMMHSLDDKKTTAEFHDILQRYFFDAGRRAPAAMQGFIQLGMEVVADLVKKKDPPAWYEVVAVVVMGVAQMVAGALIKAFLPLVGELIGNALISSGLDDLIFAVTSAINGDFSWGDYAAMKVESLKRSFIQSAVTCGIGFIASAVSSSGGLAGALEAQKMTGIERAQLAQGVSHAGSAIGSQGYSIGAYVLKEVGLSALNRAVGQMAGYGLRHLTSLVKDTYKGDLLGSITATVNQRWPSVLSQAVALYQRLGGKAEALKLVQDCVQQSLRDAARPHALSSVTRAAKLVMPAAATLVGKGWDEFLTHAPELIDLGISIPKLTQLVDSSLTTMTTRLRQLRTAQAAAPTDQPRSARALAAEAVFTATVEGLSETYASGLYAAFNSTLDAAVFSPLVSLGAQKMTQAAGQAVLSKEARDLEALARNNQAMLHAKRVVQLGDRGLDEVYRALHHATLEVTHPTEEQLASVPVNGQHSVATLKQQFGDLLRVYQTEDGQLYVNRPTAGEYAEAVRHQHKPGSDPEVFSLCRHYDRDIVVHTSDGHAKVYHTTGLTETVAEGDLRSAGDSIHLKMDKAADSSSIGHMSPYTAAIHHSSSREYDCLYEAVLAEAEPGRAHGQVDIEALRETTAHRLEGVEDSFARQFYSDWLIHTEEAERQFVGHRRHHHGEEQLLLPWTLTGHSDLSVSDIAHGVRHLAGSLLAPVEVLVMGSLLLHPFPVHQHVTMEQLSLEEQVVLALTSISYTVKEREAEIESSIAHGCRRTTSAQLWKAELTAVAAMHPGTAVAKVLAHLEVVPGTSSFDMAVLRGRDQRNGHPTLWATGHGSMGFLDKGGLGDWVGQNAHLTYLVPPLRHLVDTLLPESLRHHLPDLTQMPRGDRLFDTLKSVLSQDEYAQVSQVVVGGHSLTGYQDHRAVSALLDKWPLLPVSAYVLNPCGAMPGSLKPSPHIHHLVVPFEACQLMGIGSKDPNFLYLDPLPGSPARSWMPQERHKMGAVIQEMWDYQERSAKRSFTREPAP